MMSVSGVGGGTPTVPETEYDVCLRCRGVVLQQFLRQSMMYVSGVGGWYSNSS